MSIESAKRRIFIGCSTEALHIAQSVKTSITQNQKINRSVEVILWTETQWGNLRNPIDSINENIDSFYYAIFIAYPDDILESRGERYYTTRDNVIFEFGLFLSRLGIERTFLMLPVLNKPEQLKFKQLSDITGGTVDKYALTFQDAQDQSVDSSSSKWMIDAPNSQWKFATKIEQEEKKIDKIYKSKDKEKLLKSKVDALIADLSVSEENDQFYINKFKNKLEEILYSKHCISKGGNLPIQEIIIDILESIKDVRDFCKPNELAKKQSYKNGIKNVWIFGSNPLEFEDPSDKNRDFINSVKNTVIDNLENQVMYTYFVDDTFSMTSLDRLLTGKEHLKNCVKIIQIDSKYFTTFFTLHFSGDDGSTLESLYMSSLLTHRNDLLIQITDDHHIKRIRSRLETIRGHDKSQNTGLNSFVSYTLRGRLAN
jgi:predicted nucleotide-binding protein